MGWFVPASLPTIVCAVPQHNALDAAGVQAEHIVALWNFTLVVCGVVFMAVVLAALVALVRRRSGPRQPEPAPPDLTSLAQPEHRTRRVVIVISLVSVVLLVGLIVADVATDRALSDLPVDRPLHIQLTGEQSGGRRSIRLKEIAPRPSPPMNCTCRWAGRWWYR
ncbi:hypothetical protein [Paraburkholderia tropica]|uniref:hypothetical protein n=1 Tax=Paraburkholderia tropica TaxID=92647 RepID=UPI003D267CB8